MQRWYVIEHELFPELRHFLESVDIQASQMKAAASATKDANR